MSPAESVLLHSQLSPVDDLPVRPDHVGDAPLATAVAIERSVYSPSGASRLGGMVGTATIFIVVASLAFLTFSHALPIKNTAHLTVFDVPAPSPPDEVQPPEPPPYEEEKTTEVEPAEPARAIEPVVTIKGSGPVVPPAPTPSQDVVQPKPPTPAPPPAPPPAQRRSGQEAKTWEDRVLASLISARRYPRLAMARRQQGIPYVRFVVDRQGRVLSSRIERSSGHAELDREAAALLRRVSPVPAPPEDRTGETFELLVPIEFFLG